MASTYVNDLRLEEIGDGEQSGTWGATTNTNLELIGEAFSYGTEAITTNADTHSTTIADGATDPGRSMYMKYTGTLDSTCTVSLLPNTVSKLWFIENATSGGFNLSIKQGTGAEIVIPNGDVKVVYSDGAGGGAAIFDALVDLNIATKLTIKNPATSASPATVLLQAGDTDVAVNDVLGKIQFQAPDEAAGTDAILVAAEIAAASEGDFSSSNNATKLSFKTAASEAAAEKMSLSSGGNLTVSGTYNGGGTMTTGGNIVIPDGGNIGSASDTDALSLSAAGALTATAGGAAATPAYAITNGSIGVNGMFVGSANTLSFCTAATERMKITSGGHLVAFADSTYDLGANATRWRQAYIDEIDVGANTSLAASAANAVFVGYAGGGSEYGVEIKTDASTGTAIYFLHSTTTACGSVTVGSSATAYNTSSDYRLKENVVDMSGAITRLKTLKPKRFSWIADENSELLDGFLAHEVDEVVPQAIHGEKDETKDVGTIKDADGDVLSENVIESEKEDDQTWEKTATENIYQGIDQAKLVPLLTGALQEAITKIESLEARVAALETQED